MERIRSNYRILIYQENEENLVITQNLILWRRPNKSEYEPQPYESNGTVDFDTMQEVTEFLEMFFAFYLIVTDKELTYYVKDNDLPSIGKDYLFSELVHPVFQTKDNQIIVWITVKYIDETTKAAQFSQYVHTLEKDTDWMIMNYLVLSFEHKA